MARKVRRNKGKSVYARARQMKEYYYSVIVPFTAKSKSPWAAHKTGPFTSRSVGVFKTQREARAWAVSHLGTGVKFEIKKYLKFGGKTDKYVKRFGFAGD